MNNHTVWRKCIQNPPETPWLDWIEAGIKTYEGRLLQNDWAKMAIGDFIELYVLNTSRQTTVVITELHYYKDFGGAWQDLGQALIPLENTTENIVKELYWQYFNQTDIDKYGVVAVGVKPI